MNCYRWVLASFSTLLKKHLYSVPTLTEKKGPQLYIQCIHSFSTLCVKGSVNSLLHDLSCLGPGPQSLPHIPVSVVESSQVHVGVDVLVIVVLLSRTDGLRESERERALKHKEQDCLIMCLILFMLCKASSPWLNVVLVAQNFIQHWFEKKNKTKQEVLGRWLQLECFLSWRGRPTVISHSASHGANQGECWCLCC